MNVIIQKTELETMLGVVMNTVGGKVKPVLACVRIKAADGRLSCYTTNLAACMIADTPYVQIEAEGAAVVTASTLLEVVRCASSDHLVVTADASYLTVTSASGKAKLHVIATEAEFPPPPTLDGQMVTTKAAALRRTFERVGFAVAREATRYAFAAIAIMPGSPARACCTDGRRLAVDALDFDFRGEQTLVPGEARKPLAAMLTAAADGDAEVWISASRFSVKCDGLQYTTSLIEGQFPPVDDIVPKEPNFKGNAGVASLIRCLKSVSVFTNEEGRGIRLGVKARKLSLSARHVDRGDGFEEMTCGIDGEMLIGLNPIFLSEYLKRCDGDMVDIEMTAPNRPMVLRDEKRVYVLMPINLQ